MKPRSLGNAATHRGLPPTSANLWCQGTPSLIETITGRSDQDQPATETPFLGDYRLSSQQLKLIGYLSVNFGVKVKREVAVFTTFCWYCPQSQRRPRVRKGSHIRYSARILLDFGWWPGQICYLWGFYFSRLLSILDKVGLFNVEGPWGWSCL